MTKLFTQPNIIQNISPFQSIFVRLKVAELGKDRATRIGKITMLKLNQEINEKSFHIEKISRKKLKNIINFFFLDVKFLYRK